MQSHDVSQPAAEILSYFLRNPAAADSLEGIARWRLLEQTIHRTIAETETALNWLVKQGYLVEVAQPRSRILFRLNQESLKRAKALLRTRRKA